jgi:hypothetical protein
LKKRQILEIPWKSWVYEHLDAKEEVLVFADTIGVK